MKWWGGTWVVSLQILHMPNHVRGLDEGVKARRCALIKVISLKLLRSTSVNYYVKNITLLIESLYWAIPYPGPGYD